MTNWEVVIQAATPVYFFSHTSEFTLSYLNTVTRSTVSSIYGQKLLTIIQFDNSTSKTAENKWTLKPKSLLIKWDVSFFNRNKKAGSIRQPRSSAESILYMLSLQGHSPCYTAFTVTWKKKKQNKPKPKSKLKLLRIFNYAGDQIHLLCDILRKENPLNPPLLRWLQYFANYVILSVDLIQSELRDAAPTSSC